MARMSGRGATGIALRPATPDDNEFCFQLHKAAMGEYVTAAWGWDDRVQRGFHARGFEPARWRIITAGGADIGMISVEHRPAEIYLARIEILPEHQGHGIGASLISALIDKAARRGQDLVLDVLAVNPRARALYQRLGLREVARRSDGDGVVRITMRSGRPRGPEEPGAGSLK
jgi:ribosomal protein S18 acetylase RimI-like enzyme